MRKFRGIGTPEQRIAEVERWRRSGMSQVEYAKSRGMARSTLALWVHWSKHREPTPPTRCSGPNCCNYFRPCLSTERYCTKACLNRAHHLRVKARRILKKNGENTNDATDIARALG